MNNVKNYNDVIVTFKVGRD